MGLRKSVFALVLGTVVALSSAAFAFDDLPVRVAFPSAHGQTMLTGYLFEPTRGHGRKVSAVVMMHGRAGAYSSKADGVYDASTLSQRHVFWGHFWADHGYAALLVDGFGPRGYPHGFPAHSYDARPEALNEVTVRPLDAYGALRYLKGRPEIDDHILLQGWSNGGSATMAAMSDTTLTSLSLAPKDGFKGAVAFYPACGLHDRFASGFHPYAPLRLFSGDADEEVSAKRCAALVQAARPGSDLAIQIYEGATHDFDDPGRKRQGVPENRVARDHAVLSSLAFMRVLSRR